MDRGQAERKRPRVSWGACERPVPRSIPRVARGHAWKLLSARLRSSAISALTLFPANSRLLRGRFIREPIHNPLDPCFHGGCAKVQQQANAVISKPKISLKLLDVDRCQYFNRLHLDE